MHKYEGFTVTCDKCKSNDCYAMETVINVILVCNNPECGQEQKILELNE